MFRCESFLFRLLSTSTQVLNKVEFVSKTKSHLLLVISPYISICFHIGHDVISKRTNEIFKNFTPKTYNIWPRYSTNVCSILLLQPHNAIRTYHNHLVKDDFFQRPFWFFINHNVLSTVHDTPNL